MSDNQWVHSLGTPQGDAVEVTVSCGEGDQVTGIDARADPLQSSFTYGHRSTIIDADHTGDTYSEAGITEGKPYVMVSYRIASMTSDLGAYTDILIGDGWTVTKMEGNALNGTANLPPSPRMAESCW